MNFVKPRKHLDEKNAKEPIEKSRRDRYQRSDSARLLLVQHQPKRTQEEDDGTLFKKITTTDSPRVIKVGLTGSSSEFKPEELPDGAFYRPKNDLKNLQTAVPPVQDSLGAGTKVIEFVRRAEYIGTFSVSGSDKEARERQMESQLEQMRSARERMPVNVIITNSGVKVVHPDSNNLFMEHSLKRIWYATCDPEYCQFSFLAREPKTSAEVQYCHAFVTQTAEQAEELISVIGDAFRLTDSSETKKPPTFNELIEQQVQQQQAKFRETEKEAQSALQQKLKEIATPTPFSERAQFRMEQRRQSEDVFLPLGVEKVLSKQQAEQPGSKPTVCPDKSASNIPGNRRSEIPTRLSTPQSSPLKRNSVPPQAAMLSTSVPSSLATNSLSVMAIKESMESRSSNTKFKGSPVTALKNEIDRRLSIPNGDDLSSLIDMNKDLRKDQAKPPKQQPKPMSNRPLPLPPAISRSPQQSRRQPAVQQPVQQSQPVQLQHPLLQQPPPAVLRHSLDDNHLPRSSSSQIPLSSNARSKASNVVLRNSPKKRPPRPMSEIATSSSGAAGAGSVRGYSEHQQQALLNNFAESFNLPTHPETGPDGMYIYGPSLTEPDKPSGFSSSHPEGGRHFSAGDTGKLETGGSTQCFKKSEAIRPFDTSQPQTRQNHIQVYPTKQGPASGQSAQGPRRGSMPNQETANVAVLRYQNDSPFQNDRPDTSSKQAGFESLMCLDRSHIQDEALRTATWYQAGLPREIALEILQQEEVGAFIVRDSSSHPGCYALSVRVPKYENASGISHYLILRTHRGVKLKGLEKEWSTLTALVTHHTVMRELLPCTLRLPKVKGQETQSPSSQRHSGGSTSHGEGSNPKSDNLDQS